MTTELTVLAYAVLWQIVQICLMALPANLELGSNVTLGARDGAPLVGKLSRGVARLHRAMTNHFEGLILFTIAVLTVSLSDGSSTFTRLCAWVYLIARIAYVPAYYLGLSPWRTVIWSIGMTATALMLVAALI